jgi:hypothetical protein
MQRLVDLVHRSVRPLLMAGLLAGVGPGCVLEVEDPPEPGCTDEARAGLMITVVDAWNGRIPIPATITLTDGSYTETVGPDTLGGEQGLYAAAWERPGVYDIQVSSPGYGLVIIEDVEVRADECHVITEQLEVPLQPVLPPPCTPSIEPGLVVVIKDALTSEPIAAEVVLRDGDYEEVVGGNDPGSISGTYAGAFERPGVYTITIRGEGYGTVVLEMVEVTADECHVNTEQITIALESIPA